jgi:putative flippase GtrA
MGSKEKNFLREVIIFNIVGSINTVLTYGIYSLFIVMGIDYKLALILEYCFGITFSFLFNRRFTFRHNGTITIRMVSSMLGAYIFVLGINLLLLIIFVEKFAFNKYFGQFTALAISVMISFFAQKLLVFRKKV